MEVSRERGVYMIKNVPARSPLTLRKLPRQFKAFNLLCRKMILRVNALLSTVESAAMLRFRRNNQENHLNGNSSAARGRSSRTSNHLELHVGAEIFPGGGEATCP